MNAKGPVSRATRKHTRPFEDTRGGGSLDAVEEAQLRRLVYQAFELRDGPYFRDACEAIVAWNERTLPDRLERRARARRA
jgi:hypothetical protein